MAQMGFLFIFLLFLKPVICQQQTPNTDGYFLSNFLQTMRPSSNPPSQNLYAPVCLWEGVFCDSKRESVIGFVASGLSLSGLIPENSIGKLSNLQFLDLSKNEITGFSADFWSLGSLKFLNLSFNLISGNLPTNIGNFGLLQTLDLSFNNFSGEIPQSISSLGNLQTLRLNQNGFESGIPSGIVNCQSLGTIDLSSNRLVGNLPDQLLAEFPNLKSLNIADNMITGQALDFSLLISVTYVNFSRNLFQGAVVGLFQEPRVVIDLSQNQFRGNISQVHNWSSLVYVDVSENQLSGEISASFEEAMNLKHLNLAYNRFYAREFPNINMLSVLEYLNLSGTSLIGHIPVGISKLDHLGTLDVSINNLTGEIPLPVLNKIQWMERFNFSYNNLTLCPSGFSLSSFRSAFVGTTNTCPIAVKPESIRKKADRHRVLFLALALVSSLVCLLAVLLISVFGCRKQIRKQELSYVEERCINSGGFSFHTAPTTSVPVVIFEKPLLNLTFADLLLATSHFDRATLLAEGSKYGPIYRGSLPGGFTIAVKVLEVGGDSTVSDQEAGRELDSLGRMRHPNLVSMIGYCLSGEKKIAIYDYMENGNLENLLHEKNRGEENLISSWSFRHKIALGIARALAFLHHGSSPPIVHREVKASNIYLDFYMEPRLFGSGLARIFGNDVENEVDDENDGLSFSGSFLSPKFDVYGFGVVLLELVTGKKETGGLVGWVRELVRNNESLRAIDPRIIGSVSEIEMEEAIKIGYLCTADLSWKRPSMQQVVGLLKDIHTN